MNKTPAIPPHLSLTALRGAVGEVVGTVDAVSGWDRLVALWRIFWALDELMAVLWSIVDRLRSGEIKLDGLPSSGAVAVQDEPTGVAGSGLGLRRSRVRTARLPAALTRPAVAGVGVMEPRRVPADVFAWPGVVSRGMGLVAVPPVLVNRLRRSSNLGWSAMRNCVLFVPVN